MEHIDFPYDTRHSNELKVYASDEERTSRFCGIAEIGNIKVRACPSVVLTGIELGILIVISAGAGVGKRNRKFDRIIKA